ncbi:hypothetical protein ABZ840_08100 [Streptomyces sp. NPDC047117]|uniref:hypothetical protein n=1 Tax=Streptomyces sp. NPDC047117 TaxID=3155379 RepID=UPI0033E68587
MLTTAGPASAAPLDLTCTPPSSNLIRYSPPLSNRPQPTTIDTTTQYGPCTSLTQPGVTSGIRSSHLTGTLSCLELLAPTRITFTITWNTGQTSTVQANVQSSLAGATLTVVTTGTVTSGLFAGDSVVQTNVGAATDTAVCTLGLGTVSSIYSTVTLEITSV